MRRSSSRAIPVAVCALAAACGGDGGGITISWDPAALEATFPQGEPALELGVTARLSSVPDAAPYVSLVDAEGVLQDQSLQVEQLGPKTFATSLRPRCTLPPGEHSGTLEVRLCQDAACAEAELGSGRLPYHFTVTAPEHTLTVSVDGVVSAVGFRCNLAEVRIASGQVLEVVAGEAVTWDVWAMPYNGQISLVDPQTTSTSYRAIVDAAPECGELPPADCSAGTVYLQAFPVSAPWMNLNLRATVPGT